ncbi:MAG: MerC domain-containing protein [Filimonas sp.]|nr:MerC domain-containing protein [Filimonas sp.]
MGFKINWDALGITASVACAIHCALLPLFLSSLPIFGVELIHNDFFEYFMIFLAFAIGAYALYHGWKRHHHSWVPFLTFTVGILCLVGKQIWHSWQLVLLIPAVILIVSGHYINYRLCRKAAHCHEHDCAHD